MGGRWRGYGVRGRWWRAVVGVCGAVGLVLVGVQSVDSGVVPGHVGLEVVEAGVYFDQVGLSIDGVDPAALSADGDRLAADGWRLDASRRVGFVRVFDWDGVRWTQVGADIDEGHVLAMSADGNRVAIGAVGLYSRVGYVQVHEWDGAGWSELGPLMYGEAAGEGFARSVELSADGGRMLIGTADRAMPGSVRVLEWDGAGWSQVGADIEGDAGFGWSAAMSVTGDRVAASEAPQFLRDGSDRTVAGYVRVFDWDGAGWSQVGGDIDAVGDDVALSGSGDRLAVGMRGDYDVGPTGRVWVADLVGGSWVIVDDSGEQVWGRPAQSVALSADGHRLVYSGNRLNGPIDVSPGETVVRDEGPSGWADVGVIRGEFYDSSDDWGGLSADGDRLAIGGSGYLRVFDISATTPPPLAGPVSLVPARLLDSRAGAETVDGVAAGIGRRSPGSVTEVLIAGRGGVPSDALGVVLDVVAVHPDADGFLTVFPCGTAVPSTSNLNYAPGQIIANSVFTGIGTGGTVCIYSHASTDLVVDVTGFAPLVRSALRPMNPDRLMDTRTGIVVTGYETWVEVDRLPAGSVTKFSVTGWPNRVPYEASAVMLDVVAVHPDADGYLTVFPCGTPIPLASTLNYAPGQVIANMAFTRLGTYGSVCIYTHATTDVVVDATGYTLGEDGLWSLVPARNSWIRVPGPRPWTGCRRGSGGGRRGR